MSLKERVQNGVMLTALVMMGLVLITVATVATIGALIDLRLVGGELRIKFYHTIFTPLQEIVAPNNVAEYDRSDMFAVNETVERKTRAIIPGHDSDRDKAQAIFEWCYDNIKYGPKYSYYFVRTAQQVYDEKQGICIGLSLLYCAMARIAGMEARVADVEKDHDGDEVDHACSAVWLNSEWVLVDVSYRKYDVDHESWEFMSDSYVNRVYGD